MRCKDFCFVVMLYAHLFIKENTNAVTTGVGEAGSNLTISFREYHVMFASGKVMENMTLLPPLSNVTINIVNIPPDVSFVLLQAHSFIINVTLSYGKVLTPHLYTTGTDVGLVRILKANQKTAQFVLWNPSVDENATVLVAAQGYGKDAPVPGGCNMEFSVEIAPFLLVGHNSSLVWVEWQPAAVTVPPIISSSCENQDVELQLYHVYLPERDFSSETYFNTIRMMMTAFDMNTYGKRVDTTLEGSQLRRLFSLYPGTGSVYGVVAVSGFTGAAYVPAVTYGCNVAYWADTCEVLTTTFSKLLYALILFVGIFLCFFGHRFFKCEMFIFGFFVAAVVCYICIDDSSTTPALEGLPIIAGIAFGILWLLFWCSFGMPFVSVLIATSSLGFLVASVVMYAGIADVQIFENEINFWMVFASIAITIPILCSSEILIANILCCGVLGAYAVVIPIDHYIGSNLKYILLNTIRRATVKDFRLALIDPPFQMRDIILVSVWFGLAALGVTYQWYEQRGRPPFPAPPCRNTRARRQPRRARFPTDRTPLLVDHGPGVYGSTPLGGDSSVQTQAARPFPILPKFAPSAPPVNKELF